MKVGPKGVRAGELLELAADGTVSSRPPPAPLVLTVTAAEGIALAQALQRAIRNFDLAAAMLDDARAELERAQRREVALVRELARARAARREGR